MLRKIICLFLVFVLSIGVLSGCKGNKDKNEQNNENKSIGVEDVVFNTSEIEIEVGESYNINATVSPEKYIDAKLVWDSSDSSVATVSRGYVTGVSVGSAIITATAENGKYANCIVNVVDSDKEPNSEEETPDVTEGHKVGNKCPSYTLSLLDGSGTVNINDYKGKKIVINFWGTWCGPCKNELPDFNKIASDYADDTVVIAIHSVASKYQAPSYVRSNFPDSKIIFAVDEPLTDVSDMYFTLLGGRTAYPRTLILDERGIIQHARDGVMEYEEIADILNSISRDNSTSDDKPNEPSIPVNPNPGGEELPTDSQGNVIVKIMFHVDKSSTEGQAYQKRINAFNAAYKDKGIKAQAIFKARSAGASGYETELLNNQLEETLADIITFYAPNTAAYANSGLLYDITDLISAEEQDKFYSLNTYEGKLYGLPIQESSAGFFYNKNIFRAAGIDVSGYTAENPWTFAQFKEVCAKLKAAGYTAVDMRLDATKDETAPYLLYPFIYAAGGNFTSDDGYTANGYYNSAATASGFQFIKDLISADYTSYAIGATDFFTGKVGMYLSSGWTIPDLDNKYRECFASRDDWGLLPYPKDVQAASSVGGWCYAITNNHHPNKTAILELYKWMTSAESSVEITNATGMIPARKDVDKNYEVGSPEYTLLKQLELSGKERPVTVAYPTFSTTFNQVIAGLGNSDVDVSRLLDYATNTLQSEMDRIKKLWKE